MTRPMQPARFSMLVHAPVEVVWALLLEKTEDPTKLVPSIRTCEISEREGSSFLRTMTTDAFEVAERFTIDAEALRISSTYVRHPKYTGTTVKQVTRPASEDGYPTLTYSLAWQVTDPDFDSEPLQSLAMRGVKHTKSIAEARATNL